MSSVLALLILAGCSTLERSMAGKIGCPSDEIQIVSSDPGWGFVNSTWVAQCRGQKFVCSLRSGARDVNDFSDMDCAPMVGEVRGGDYQMSDARTQSFEEWVKSKSQKKK